MFSQLKQGDVVNRNGEFFQILGVCGEVVFFEEDTIVLSRSKRELEAQGYRLLKDAKPWMPKVGQLVWFFNGAGNPWVEEYGNWGCQNDFIAFGNCFKTQAEAILARDKVKELLKSIKEG